MGCSPSNDLPNFILSNRKAELPPSQKSGKSTSLYQITHLKILVLLCKHKISTPIPPAHPHSLVHKSLSIEIDDVKDKQTTTSIFEGSFLNNNNNQNRVSNSSKLITTLHLTCQQYPLKISCYLKQNVNNKFLTQHSNNKHITICTDLMYAECAKGKWFASLGVHHQHLHRQDKEKV